MNRTTTPVDIIFSGEFELDAPPAEAWPHVINYPTWQDFPIADHVSGERGGEGEVVRLKKETEAYTIGPYFARTLKLEPGSRVIWKVYIDPSEPVEGVGDAADVAGTVEFRVAETGDGKTRFTYNLIYEYLVPYSDPAQVAAYREQQYRDWSEAFMHNFENLKRLVATGAAVSA
jgi:hypothetical protein